jgi:hypothetical protein
MRANGNNMVGARTLWHGGDQWGCRAAATVPSRNLKKDKFCRHDDMKRLTSFNIKLKTVNEIGL